MDKALMGENSPLLSTCRYDQLFRGGGVEGRTSHCEHANWSTGREKASSDVGEEVGVTMAGVNVVANKSH